MIQPNHDEYIPVATLVEPARARKNLGCILAVVAALLIFVSIAAVAIWLLLSSIRDNESRLKAFNADPERLVREIQAELETARISASRPGDAQSHLQHDRIAAFVDALRPLLGQQNNPDLQAHFDFDLHLNEVLQRSGSMSRSPFLRSFFRESLKQQTVGPAPFDDFEILRIENDGDNRYRVYLSYSMGYEFSEPHCWWISDRDRRLKLYDWCQLELGLRDSTETAILYDATDQQTAEYHKFVKHNDDYCEFSGEGLSNSESRRKTAQILAACEEFNGPPELLPNTHLITARRWHYEEEDQRALALLEKIPNPDLVPGVYSLTGDIQLERGNFAEVVEAYQNYIRVLGPMHHVQTQLANCFREMGDLPAERAALSLLMTAIVPSSHDAVARMIELSSPSENQQLFLQIDQLNSREAVYFDLARHFCASEFYSDRLQQIHAHLQKTAPGSLAELFAAKQLNPNPDTHEALLLWMEESDDHDGDELHFLKYNFWYSLDETQLIQLFEKLAQSKDLRKHFNGFCEFIELEGRETAPTAMLRVSQIVLEKYPDDYRAFYQQGATRLQLEEFQLAVADLKKSLELVPAESPAESPAEWQIRERLIAALNQSGDQAGALELADDEEQVIALLSLKTDKNDFSDWEKLLERLKPDSNAFQFYSALLVNHQGDRASAIEGLAKLVNSTGTHQSDYSSSYSYRYKLIELCEQEGDITKAFELVPDFTMFEVVSYRLVAKLDWVGCEKLLQLETAATEEIPVAQFRQQMEWEQGNYQQVVDQAEEMLEVAQTEDVSLELDRLVRSALRIDKLDVAMRFAESAAELDGQQDLVALVALRSSDAQRLASALEPLSQWQLRGFEDDPDLRFTDWRSRISAAKLPARDLRYYPDESLQFKLELLFSQPQAFPGEQLLTQLKQAFREQVQVESGTAVDKESESSWIVRTDGYQMFLTLEALDGSKFSETCTHPSLKEALGASVSRMNLTAFALKPTTEQADQETGEAIIRCFAREDLQAVAKYSQWLIRDEITRWLELAKGTGSARLFSGEGFEGKWFDSKSSEELKSKLKSETLPALIAALKQQFEYGTGGQSLMVVQFRAQEGSPEKISAQVDRLHRSRYATVALQARILHDSRFDSSIRQGDQVLISLEQVENFEFRYPKMKPQTTSGL